MTDPWDDPNISFEDMVGHAFLMRDVADDLAFRIGATARVGDPDAADAVFDLVHNALQSTTSMQVRFMMLERVVETLANTVIAPMIDIAEAATSHDFRAQFLALATSPETYDPYKVARESKDKK